MYSPSAVRWAIKFLTFLIIDTEYCGWISAYKWFTGTLKYNFTSIRKIRLVQFGIWNAGASTLNQSQADQIHSIWNLQC